MDRGSHARAARRQRRPRRRHVAHVGRAHADREVHPVHQGVHHAAAGRRARPASGRRPGVASMLKRMPSSAESDSRTVASITRPRTPSHRHGSSYAATGTVRADRRERRGARWRRTRSRGVGGRHAKAVDHGRRPRARASPAGRSAARRADRRRRDGGVVALRAQGLPAEVHELADRDGVLGVDGVHPAAKGLDDLGPPCLQDVAAPG